jgi:carbonic anhydrase
MNCLSVLQYAVDVLKVRHIIVCGHYGCGGVKASLESRPHGLVNNWLRHLYDVYIKNERELTGIADYQQRLERLCEINVIQQATNAGDTTIVHDAWQRGQDLHIHCWIYRIADGLLKELASCISSDDDLRRIKKG